MSRAINELARQICFKRSQWLDSAELEMIRNSQPAEASAVANAPGGEMRDSFLASYKQSMPSSDQKSNGNAPNSANNSFKK